MTGASDCGFVLQIEAGAYLLDENSVPMTIHQEVECRSGKQSCARLRSGDAEGKGIHVDSSARCTLLIVSGKDLMEDVFAINQNFHHNTGVRSSQMLR